MQQGEGGDKSKKKTKPSLAHRPIMPKVEVPPKPAPSTVPPKDITHIEDDTENIGGSGKDVSTSMPSFEGQQDTSAEDLANDASKNKEVAHGTPLMHPQFFPVLRRAPLHQRYNEITK
jgi:hypothetical protein